jgi:hypothetical protein
MKRRLYALAVFTSVAAARPALAGDLDAAGEYAPDPAAAAFVGFEADPARYLPDDVDPKCIPPAFTLATAGDALGGQGFGRVSVLPDCAERFLVDLPPIEGSYRVTAWLRHGLGSLSFIVLYKAESGLARVNAVLGPTGRATSDGWIEMASNEVPVDGAQVEAAYLRVIDLGAAEATEIDSLEVVPAGSFEPAMGCHGAGDPVCGPEALCSHGACAAGRLAVPPLPPDALRDEVVDAFSARLRTYFGGARSRKERLPQALATIELMRKAETAWQFWGGLSRAVRQLGDWHTGMGLPLGGDPRYRLNACFIEGDADLSQAAWPKHPQYADILVSHAGGGAAGLHAGDRLVAVDGQHPLAWARSLVDANPNHHTATDPAVDAELAESMGGPFWGGGLIIRFAETITVLRCDAAEGTCAGAPETIEVATLTDPSGDDVVCDNRPFYHFQSGNPPANHAVFWDFFDGKIAGTTDEEAIYGVVWDTLYGGGDPDGYVNGKLGSLMNTWRQSARGVILDHRAGNGGTLDSPELLTTLVRPRETLGVVLMPVESAAADGPKDAAEGQALFAQFEKKSPFIVGADDHDPTLPVALVVHRDGSASDYLPLGMKGAPTVRIFGPHATAGAFSTFVNVAYHGAFDMQIASGDTVTSDGSAWIGHGVVPDEVVPQRQSDLLAGKDSIHEAALAWLRANLKDVGDPQ